MTTQDKGAAGTYIVEVDVSDMLQPLTDEIARLRAENEALRADGEFLLARLDELEWVDGRLEKTPRDFMGHVEPAIERLRAALGPKEQAT